MSHGNFELKTDSKGNPNPKYVDLLEEDKPISGQKFVCVSFVSPEKILKQKQNFYFENFIKHWDFNKALEKYNQFLNFISYKYEISFDSVTADLQEFLKEEKDKLINTTIEDDFKNFMDNNEEKLDDQFNAQYNFQTSTRGVKIRGVFSTQEEAELRCKLLREVDPNHDVYVGPVGMWMPWEPEAYKTGRVEYMEEELNKLMSEKNKNEEKAKVEFEKRIKDAKKKAIADNIKLATETGNKLTQTIDEQGNLVGVGDAENSEATVSDIHKELFESQNAVIGESDHGLSRILENQQEETIELGNTVEVSSDVSNNAEREKWLTGC